ncbi:MAG: hypothetical protein CR982_06750 [Candidatus Cloacimonadota bacterium]|nr:MAG: hypothetical protein CR982_06750 [Candidatus Cloacimonadota bacterium]PIE77818.1 MAG: hypothetical protein CSA15_11015 [Candidatus Delongbacteria bacterium]
MRKFVYLFLLLMMILGNSSFAQESLKDPMKYGVKFGINSSNIINNDEALFNPTVGFNFGGLFEYRFNNIFGFQTELLFTMKGAEYDMGIIDVEQEDISGIHFDGDIITTYLEIPLLANIYFFENENFSSFFQIGSSIGLNMSAKEEVDIDFYYEDDLTVVGATESIDDDIDDYEKVDFGIDFGLGLMYKKFYLDTRYTFGLSKIMDMELDKKYDPKNVSFALSVGYCF